jgi:hypothetical protein
MNSSLFPSLWRFLGLVLAQGLLFLRAGEEIGLYFNILIYPLFILLLPVKMPTPAVVVLGALAGFAVDLFYGSWGVHASAGAFSGWARSFVLAAYKPKGDFTGKEPIAAPAHFGWQWFFQVAGFFFALHLFWYFSMDAFSFVYFGSIALKTIAAWILSMIFVVLYCVLFEPKN